MTRTARELAIERARQIRAGEVRGGLPTGIRKLDAVIGGLGDFLHVVGGPTGGGKSTLLLSMAVAVGSQDGRHPYVWSGEDPVGLTCDRLLAALCGVPAERLGSGLATPDEKDQVSAAAEDVGEWFLDDQPGTARDVLARAWAVKDRVSCFFGDYTQVYTPSSDRTPPDSRDHVVEVVTTHSRYSAAAKIPVVLGSQFTKEAQNRGKRTLDASKGADFSGYVPDLGDLHGSSEIMKRAKCVLLVSAPGTFNPDPAVREDFNIYVGKQNFGSGRGKVVRCKWRPELSTVY